VWDVAFLLPGNDLDFDHIEYRNFPLVVLNLRAPSVPSASSWRHRRPQVPIQLPGVDDLAQSELRLE
jgi:hypothetical protein